MTRKNLTIVAVVLFVVVGFVIWRQGRAPSRSGAPGKADNPATQAVPTSSPLAPGQPDPLRAEPASIAGAVRDTSGAPLDQATVCVRAQSRWLADEQTREPRCTRSGVDGHYQLKGLLPALYQVSAAAAGHLPAVYEQQDGTEALWLRAGQKRTDIDLQLRPGGVEVHGLVLDIGGGPVADAWVTVSPAGGAIRAPSFARTDADGRFTSITAPGRVILRATADGYGSGLDEGVAPGLTLTIYLTPESAIAGQVVEAGSRRPVPGVRVTVGSPVLGFSLIGDDRQTHGSALTDQDGRFRITRLVPARYKPVVRAAGLYGEAGASVLLGLGETRDDLVIEVHPAYTISGRVVTDGGAPCPAGRVWASDSALGRELRGQTGSDGTVRIDGALPGTYKIRVRCRGYLQRAEYPDISVERADVTEQVWTVEAGSEIAGTVRDSSGAAIADAWIEGRVMGDIPAGQSTMVDVTTDTSGRFSATGMVAGKYALRYGAPGYPEANERAQIEVAASARVEVDLVLDSGGSIVGTVVDEAGRGLPRIMVAVKKRGLEVRDTTFTDDQGQFRLTGIKPGEVRVVPALTFGDELRAPGATDDDPFGAQVTVAAGQEAQVRLVVENRSGTISGRILDAEGKPVGSGFVSAFRESDAAGALRANNYRQARWAWVTHAPVLTDADGRFTVSGLSPGRYTLRGYRRGGGEAFVEGVALGQDVTLTIEQTQSIAGTVTRSDSTPPDTFTVTVTDRSVGFTRTERFFRVSGGAFLMGQLPAGQMTVAIEAAEGAVTDQVALAPGQARTGLTFTLSRFVTLVGRIVELGGESTDAPVPGMMVFVDPIASPGTGRPDPQKVTDAQGRFRLERVATGAAHIMAVPANFDGSPFGFARIPRVIREDGAVGGVLDVGDIRIPRNRIGLREPAADLGYTLMQPAPDVDIENQQLVVASVRPDGPAAASGLAVGDIIQTFDDLDVTGTQHFAYFTLARVKPGTPVTLGLSGGKTATITAGPVR